MLSGWVKWRSTSAAPTRAAGGRIERLTGQHAPQLAGQLGQRALKLDQAEWHVTGAGDGSRPLGGKGPDGLVADAHAVP